MKEIIDEYLKEAERFFEESRLSHKGYQNSEEPSEIRMYRYHSLYEGLQALYYQNKVIIEMIKKYRKKK